MNNIENCMNCRNSYQDWQDIFYNKLKVACGKEVSLSRDCNRLLEVQTLPQDLSDRATQSLVKEGEGFLRLEQEHNTGYFLLNYEKLRKRLKDTGKLEKLTKRCDFILAPIDSCNAPFILCELTSSNKADTSILEGEPASRKEKNSKFKKVEEQLEHTIKTLYLCDELKEWIEALPNNCRQCYLAYRLSYPKSQGTNEQAEEMPYNKVLDAFERSPLQAESLDNQRTEYPAPKLNELGFTYSRILYPKPLYL